MAFNENIMSYFPKKLAVSKKNGTEDHTFCNAKTNTDSLGRKERDKFAVNSLTLNEICTYCNDGVELEESKKQLKKTK